jgi:diadenosine tetraphosphatase ApaH/serine/threonine PP2A family protein phosphatase
MDMRDYCDSMYTELTWQKARLYDILRVLDELPVEARAKIRPQTDELGILVGDMSRRIDRLMQECPADWRKAKLASEAGQEGLN